MERVDGAQARLKPECVISWIPRYLSCGKGGWGSGEIETLCLYGKSLFMSGGKGGWGSGEIETSSG